jgi:hypothetical protein
MMRRVLILFSIGLRGIFCSLISAYGQSSLDDLNIIYKHDFENNTVGKYNFAEWSQDWLSPAWENRQSSLEISRDVSDLLNPTKALQVYYPAYSLGPEEGGTNWWTDIAKQNEIYVSYDVMFMPGFKFQMGGKLPSVKGGSVEVQGDFERPSGYDGFAGGIMFKDEGDIVFYVYYADSKDAMYGESFAWGANYYPSDYFSPSLVKIEYGSGTPSICKPGEWHNLTYRMVLNTVKSSGGGNYDGILEAYFDGKLVTEISHLLFRHTNDLGIDCMRMVTFFGGSADEWRNPINEWVKIDNVLLFTFKDNMDVPRGNTLSPTNRRINYWRQISALSHAVPDAPASLITTNQTTSSITLNWQDRSINEKGFKLYRSSDAGANYSLIASLATNVTAYTDNSLSPGTTYYYKVEAFNDNGISAAAPVLAASTINLNAPATPEVLAVVAKSTTSVLVTWKDNSADEKLFEIERRGPENMDIRSTVTVNANITAFTDAGLQENSTYSYIIRAQNNYGYSAYSNSVSVTTPVTVPPSAPSAPSLLKSTNFTDKSITIRWNDNSDNENSFVITRAPGSDPSNTVSIQVNANDTLYTDGQLESNKTYIYTVKAVNQSGISASSNQNVAFTLSMAETKRVKDGLIAYYNFGYDPAYIIHDLSGYGTPLNLRILQPNAVRWNDYNRLEVLSGTSLVSTTPANKITSAIGKTGEITMECWIRPLEPDIISSSRVVSLGVNDAEIGIVLDQDFIENTAEKAINYSVRMQTGSTSESGYPAISPEHRITYLNLQHIVYVRDTLGKEIIYVNGQKAALGFRPSNLNTWNSNSYLRLGNETDLNRPWKGTFYSLAIFDKALTREEITKNFALGPCDTIRNNGNDFTVNVYPNPVTDITHVEVIPVVLQEYLHQTSIRILDMYGKVYYQETIFNPNNQYYTTMDLSHYPSGIYFLQVLSGTRQKSTKLIVP